MTAHALDELSSEEISQLARVVRDNFSNSIRTTGKGVTNSSLKEEERDPEKMMLFNYITLAEPTREELSETTCCCVCGYDAKVPLPAPDQVPAILSI